MARLDIASGASENPIHANPRRVPAGAGDPPGREAEPRIFTVFLGAGASKSSGVPLGFEMIREWRQPAFHESAQPGADFATWCKAQPWFDKEDEYSVLFEELFPDERARQRYMEEKIEKIFPCWGYLYLANLIQNDQFNVCFSNCRRGANRKI
jgi:hypothetical protein